MADDTTKQTTEPKCKRCWGRGWYPEVVQGTEDDYIPDFRERYCDCPIGNRLMLAE